MSKYIENKIGSTIYSRIHEVRMSDADRQKALHALYDANLFVDAFMWVSRKLETGVERLFATSAIKQPALKH